jgi:uncharacterized membrane protein YeaQ/YmgE (transglycosylase-associated protein family)
MAFLVFIWSVLGLIVGLLALAARLRPVAWGRYGWCWMLVLGIGAAIVGGLLATWLEGRLFATPAALWLAVLAACLPWLWTKMRARLGQQGS